MLPCFRFGGCIGPLVEEYLIISSTYALIDYVIPIFYLCIQADAVYGPDYDQPVLCGRETHDFKDH